ncbi:MAG: SUMF1/EgtB/PvdO family nonheme iron enzyme [Hyphomicrobiaceae bacterium]|nr:SUMF1/EgtB/PvdO family nonheme iron enzyme [Hyphomicrobiaceae bacterium]
MADVFISYSKARKAEAQALAGDLAELGFDVWWDTSLVPTGTFTDEIDRQLDAATAVIVIWSPEAAKSKWVRSEAGHADRQEKLVNALTGGLAPIGIPKPFDQIHAVACDDIRSIVRALDQLGTARSIAPAEPEDVPAPEAVAEADDRLFAEAERFDTVDAYQYYIDQLPDGRHAAIARMRVRMAAPVAATPVKVAPPKRKNTSDGWGSPPTAVEALTAMSLAHKVVVGSGTNNEIFHLSHGDSIQDAPFAPEMVLVPSGKFLMGSEGSYREHPRHEVIISSPLLVGKCPVTFDEWDAYVARASFGVFSRIVGNKLHLPADQGWGRGRRPVINVSWHDAQAYAAWLSEITGKAYRLLSEAEWEYCCRAGTETAYSFGDDPVQLASVAWFWENSDQKSHPTGEKAANAFGLHDMHGNVWEWCEDAFHDSYQGAPSDGSARTSADGAASRVLRGGSWSSFPLVLRSANRNRNQPYGRVDSNGFRLARTLNSKS